MKQKLLAAHRTGFASHAFGDVANHNSITSNGCSMPGLGVDSLRVDLQFVMTPRLERSAIVVHDGNSNAPRFRDLNADGRPELVLGVSTGGIRYMTGDTLQIGSDEWRPTPGEWSVYPTPGSGPFRSEQRTQVSVHHLDGRFVGLFEVGPDRPVRTDEWPSGVYVLTSPLGRTRWIKLP